MAPFIVPRLPGVTHVFDKALRPVMIVLGGFSKDSVQETHPWHIYRGFAIADIDMRLVAAFQGTDPTRLKGHGSFLFHAPLFGGWTKYAVITADYDGQEALHFGFTLYDRTTGRLRDKGMNRLPIHGRCVRMLLGPPTLSGFFFAATERGRQVKVHTNKKRT